MVSFFFGIGGELVWCCTNFVSDGGVNVPAVALLPFFSVLPIFRRCDRFFQKDRYIFSLGGIYVSTVLNDISDITVTAVESIGFFQAH